MAKSGIIFTSQVAQSFSEYCHTRSISKALILVDSNTREFCLPLLGKHSFQHICIPAGEQFKTMETLQSVLEGMVEHNTGRDAVLFNLGGGVVSDMGGFAASIYKRGIRFVNIPTTLLGMVDAAIGGKNGVDFRYLKNYLGTFAMPDAVIISEEFLATLPEKELQSARAEIIKTGIIADPDLLNQVAGKASQADIIRACATIKDNIVRKDLYDRDIRQLLNFGHTIGHAYEACCLSKGEPVMHGEAVAKGMLFETRLAESMGLLAPDSAMRIIIIIKDQLGTEELAKEELAMLAPFLSGDKKNTGQRITFSLPTGLGSGKYGVQVPLSDLRI